MLIYNHKKEFLGMDESDLKNFGFSSLTELQDEVSDFADLFVKTPGHIHNFKHVHWIDYITCGEGATESKVIIQAKNRNFTANVDIKPLYLVESPTFQSYIVNFLNIKALSPAQDDKISLELLAQEKPSAEHISVPKHNEKISLDAFEVTTQAPKPDLSVETKEKIYEAPKAQPQPKKEPSLKAEEEEEEDAFKNYVYDPKIASEELGLPIDLVEEFVDDFIAQANSFKESLYTFLESDDFSNLRIQSHKLKGVAANLRIENALDALTVVNTSKDYKEIKHHLDRLYKIIKKLSKNEDELLENLIKKEEPLPLSIKEDVAIKDSDVPESIEILELEDDEFLKPSVTVQPSSVSDEDLALLGMDIDFADEDKKEFIDETLSYDAAKVAHEIGLDIDSFNEILDHYIEESKELCKSIEAHAKKGDFKICANLATKLRGMSENMRIHSFDNEIITIIGSQNTQEIQDSVIRIVSTLNQISKRGDK
jgi:HPt (histidine-containing phosphotransfer) domain-containing protein